MVLLNILSVRKTEPRDIFFFKSDAANLGKPIFSTSKNKSFLMLRRNTQFPVKYVTHIASYAILIMSTREFERR